MTNLLIVEDHPFFAIALLRVLAQRDDLNVVMVVDTAEKALQVIQDFKLDLILVDVSLPQMDGIELVGRLSQMYPNMPCLIISGHISNLYLTRSLAAGARGYAIKDNAKGIIEGIDQVIRGEIYISEELQTSTSCRSLQVSIQPKN
ncbi:MAG TPA: response regulator transcription factor [Anaerolineales bacterium]|nr:response regulator transcription factor [Anaerolineales bacterium]